ncbi:MAG: hypothetical protein JW957_05560 [Candidatus Omnitrophica bacterium]|nr:hypothetical protein [Candidatus Omnitrophota bacterium]
MDKKMDFIRIGKLRVSRVILGSNPFSGFSHQGPERNSEMKHYYTCARIKDVLRNAEELGINTLIARADHHMMRVIMEYRDEGGNIQWIAQTCPEVGTMERGADNAVSGGANGCYIHGGFMDFLYANNRLGEVPGVVEKIKKSGMPAGIAAHNPRVFEWAEKNLDVDFYMCSYYNPIWREKDPEHKECLTEYFMEEDRDVMVKAIKSLKKPAIHYKVMAAGRNNPEEAISFVAKHLRPQDAVCMGIYSKDKPGMLQEDITLLQKYLS